MRRLRQHHQLRARRVVVNRLRHSHRRPRITVTDDDVQAKVNEIKQMFLGDQKKFDEWLAWADENEPELAADTAEGLRVGHRVDWTIEDRNRTIADGLRSQPSDLTFAHLQKVLDGLITVSENEIRAAVRELALRAHLVAEPSGAVALAAYRKGATPPGRTVMALSGGNIDRRAGSRLSWLSASFTAIAMRSPDATMALMQSR